MNRFFLPIYIVAAGAVGTAGAAAANPAAVFQPSAEGALERARIMMAEQNFTGALDQLRLLDGFSLSPSETEDAAWLRAEAAFRRGDAGCIRLLEDFISLYPASAHSIEARLFAADYFFFRADFSAALMRYEAVGLDALSGSMLNTYTYRTAVSQLRTGHFDEARQLLKRLQGQRNFECAAKFYTAYCDYAQNRLDEAERGFQAAEKCAPKAAGDSDERYLPGGLDAEYYLTQIDFAKGRYSQVITRGQRLLAAGCPKELQSETLRVVGESAFKTGDNQLALRLLRQYAAEADTPSDTAIYTLGVLEYDRGDWSRAEELFSSLTDRQNDLAQSAYLYLGQCAVEKGDDNLAAISFRKAWELNYDPKVSETALYNYAAATTRGGNVPFASSVPMLEEFLRTFRNSEYAPRIEEYLAAAYYNEKDYARALQSINAIPKPGAKVLTAKQKILYEAGVEALSNSQAAKAGKFLTEAVGLEKYDANVARAARLWLGDALYAEGKYKAAAEAYKAFLNGERNGSNRTLALYNLAYALYMQDDFRQAASRFAEALKASPALPTALASDATLRRADCLYYTGNYAEAQALFARQAAAGGSDYALLRHATLLGISGDIEGKLRELSQLPQQFPNSKYAATALLEKAGTLASIGRNAEAEEAYRQLDREHAKAPEARKGALQLAMNLNRLGRTEEARNAYREIITRWPSSEEASLANEDLRRICAADGTLDEYARFLATIPGAPKLAPAEMEKLQFEAAQSALADNETDTALLEAYITRYPDGTYLAPALLDLADSYYSAGRSEAALAAADKLLTFRPDSPQAPEALLIKADILEETSGRKSEALAAYRRLAETGGSDFASEAAAGIMRNTTDAKERIEMARIVSRTGGLSTEAAEEARYFEALGLENAGNLAEAESIYKELAANGKSLHGAMANVALAEMLIDQKRLNEAEKLLSSFIDDGTPHQYQLARAFLLLSDVYYAKGERAKAREYVVSLKDNYPGRELDIHDMINQRLKRK